MLYMYVVVLTFHRLSLYYSNMLEVCVYVYIYYLLCFSVNA